MHPVASSNEVRLLTGDATTFASARGPVRNAPLEDHCLHIPSKTVAMSLFHASMVQLVSSRPHEKFCHTCKAVAVRLPLTLQNRAASPQ